MLLGNPQLILSEPVEATVRFRYRDTWLLLASLVLDPNCTSRERLIVRMGLDRGGNSGRAALRLRIDDLRHGARSARGDSAAIGLGADNVLAGRDTVAVNGKIFRTDVDVLRATAAALPDLTDPVEVLARVESLGPLLGGRFLEGVERGEAHYEWLLRMRRETDALVAHLWTAAGIALRDLGRRFDAHDAFRRAYERYPENADLIGELLETVGDQNTSWLGIQAAPLDILVTRLPGDSALNRGITVGDGAVLKAAVQERLSQLSRRTVNVIEKLAHLPVALPVETVEHWLDIDASDLERAVDAFPVVLKDGQLRLHREIGHIVRDHCPSERSYVIQREMVGRIEAQWLSLQTANKTRYAPDFAIQILEWVVTNGVPLQLDFLGILLADSRSFTSRPTTAAFTRYLDQTIPAGADRRVAFANLLMAHHIHADRFASALEVGIELLGQSVPRLDFNWYYLLLAAHHSENDKHFDDISRQCLDCLGAGDTPKSKLPVARLSDIHNLIAENRLARKMLEEADIHNKAAIRWASECEGLRPSLSRMLSQQAQIKAATGLAYPEVAAAWEKALASFQKDGNREGEAECLRALGQLASKQRLHALGKTLIERAIELLRAENKPDSVNATEGALAGVLAAAGDIGDALVILDRCVDYWSAKGHARWTAHFKAEQERVRKMAGIDVP